MSNCSVNDVSIFNVQSNIRWSVKHCCFLFVQLTHYKPAMKPGPIKAMKAMKVKAVPKAKVCKRPSTASRTTKTKAMKVARTALTAPKAKAKPKAKSKSKAKAAPGKKVAISATESDSEQDDVSSPSSSSSRSTNPPSPSVKEALAVSPASDKGAQFNAGVTPELCRIKEYEEEDRLEIKLGVVSQS